MFDEIVVCVFFNPGKDKALFTPEERVAMLKVATKHLPNVSVTSYGGLLSDFCVKAKAPFIVRGLRAFTDFEYEFQRALLLKKISESLETVFIMTNAIIPTSVLPVYGNLWHLAATSDSWFRKASRSRSRS